MIKILLLNYTYEVIAFITERKAIKLLFKGKAEVLSIWENIKLCFGSGFIHLPSILRMKYLIHRPYKPIMFSRTALLKRDQFACQYCGKSAKQDGLKMEVDHVLPKSRGGQSTFINCVTSCRNCNKRKAQRTPEEAGMKLLKDPVAPTGYVYYVSNDNYWHSDWNNYLRINLA